jgi:anthocyanidin 3-O-glucoside 5-O-glucosyltransferase
MKSIDKFKLIGIGPLMNAKSNADNPITAAPSDDYMEWLHSQDKSSVVYVSFGSMAVLTNTQMAELARGLVDSGRPFLWVIRSDEYGTKQKMHDIDEDDKYSKILREEHRGRIVPWCSQVEVLNHPSVGCFVTHCGWNSTLETLAMGVPVVAFPQWTDQGTNAKLIEDVWKIGVRVKLDEDKIVTSAEVIRCLEQVMGEEKCEGYKNSAKKWKDAAREAGKEGGSSDINLRAFVDQMASKSH